MLIDIQEANAKALAAIQAAQPIIKGIDTAINVVPGMKKNLILHAGPPITWAKMSGPLSPPDRPKSTAGKFRWQAPGRP